MTNYQELFSPQIATSSELCRFANANDFLKLVSAQIVFKVLNDSINLLENENEENESNSQDKTTNLNLVKFETNESYVTMRKHLNIKRWLVVLLEIY